MHVELGYTIMVGSLERIIVKIGNKNHQHIYASRYIRSTFVFIILPTQLIGIENKHQTLIEIL